MRRPVDAPFSGVDPAGLLLIPQPEKVVIVGFLEIQEGLVVKWRKRLVVAIVLEVCPCVRADQKDRLSFAVSEVPRIVRMDIRRGPFMDRWRTTESGRATQFAGRVEALECRLGGTTGSSTCAQHCCDREKTPLATNPDEPGHCEAHSLF